MQIRVRLEGCQIHPGRQYMSQKRPMSIKRVLCQSKETYKRQKRLMNIKDKDALFTSRDLLTTNKHKNMRICVLLEGCQINPGRGTCIKRDLRTSKEPYITQETY